MTSIDDRREGNDPGLDQVFRALSHGTRRRVLTALLDDDHCWMDELLGDEFGHRSDGDEMIVIELRHVHLPYLDETGFIDWDRAVDRIARGESFEELRPLLEMLEERRDRLPAKWP